MFECLILKIVAFPKKKTHYVNFVVGLNRISKIPESNLNMLPYSKPLMDASYTLRARIIKSKY